jgi:hypothetical protein
MILVLISVLTYFPFEINSKPGLHAKTLEGGGWIHSQCHGCGEKHSYAVDHDKRCTVNEQARSIVFASQLAPASSARAKHPLIESQWQDSLFGYQGGLS